MKPFNSNSFIKSFKKGYEAIPYHQGAQAAKKQVSDSIKSNGYNPEDVLSYICGQMGNPSVTLSKKDWKAIIKRAIKKGDLVGKCLEVCADVQKGKVSYEDLFSTVADHCEVNPSYLMKELYLNNVGWDKVADTLAKTEEETVVTKTEDTKAVKKVVVKKEKKTSIKEPKMDPRSKSITLVNVNTGEVKTWPSYRACEKDLYGDKGGHGCVSQLLDPKKGLKNLRGGWTLPKEEVKTPIKGLKHPRKRAIVQMKKGKNGDLKIVNTFSSITEAAKATGLSHSGISKVISGTYQSTGGYKWERINEAEA